MGINLHAHVADLRDRIGALGVAEVTEAVSDAAAGRAGREALHSFVSLESVGGFAMPLGLQESYERLIEMVDRGLRAGAGA